MLTSNSSKERSDDRVLVLKLMEGKTAQSSSGMLDNRIFTGENNVHAIRNPLTNLWYLKYDKGGLPQGLRTQKFTSFNKLHTFVKEYFKRRNIEIKEIID